MLKIKNLLRLLNESEVRDLIIGAMAFAAHGWVRATADLGPFVAADDANLDKLRTAPRTRRTSDSSRS
jgi:hypothetical protein